MIKQSPKGAIISVHVVPGSRCFSIAGAEDWTGDIKVRLKSRASEGKANQELTEELGKTLSAEVKIISGFKSRRKVLLAQTDAESAKKLMEWH